MAGSRSHVRTGRILFLETGIGYGGAALSLLHHLSALDRGRFEAVVVTPRGGPGYEDFGRVARWVVLRNEVVPRPGLRAFIRRVVPWGGAAARIASFLDYALNMIPFAVRLSLLARRERIDLVYLNNEPVSNMAGVIAARLLGIPCLAYVKGTLWGSFTTRWLLRRIDRFVAVSSFIRGELVSQGVDPDRITVIRDIRDWSAFDADIDGGGGREALGLLTGQPGVGIIGLLIPWKGQKVFIEAAARILAVHPEARFFVIGGGVEAYPDYPGELMEMVERMGLRGKVIFLGQRKDVPSLLAALDILVHASVEPEPSGGVIVEAMAMGKPVIATNIGGPPEVIEEGRTGHLIPPGDPAALAEKIDLLIRDPEHRQAVGRAAREYLKANFSLERDTRRLEAIYDEVLGEKSGRPVPMTAEPPGARVP